jgi:G3E family GTPase
LILEGKGAKHFRLLSTTTQRVGLYTQHLPSEFQLQLWHAGVAVSFIAQQEFAAAHAHDAQVTSVGIHLDGAIDEERLNQWLSALLRTKGNDIYRMKGILNIKGSGKRFVFQGVHMLFDGREDRPWGNEPRASDLVFIGRNLDRSELTQGFEQCRV